jgi:hypothetical protein
MHFLDRSTPPPSPTVTSSDKLGVATTEINPAYTTWMHQDQLILGWILSTLEPAIIAQVVDCTTTADLWNDLRSTYRETDSKLVPN